MATAYFETVIFLRQEAQGERGGILAGLLKLNKSVFRGDLLLYLPKKKVVSRKNKNLVHNYQVASDPAVTLFCDEQDVAPLSDNEYHLLKAIKSNEARYEAFLKERLDWGSTLKPGSFVYVNFKSNQRGSALIRYIGHIPNECGMKFGIEILEKEFRHQGQSDGSFGGIQYFTCEKDCALFVTLDQLSPHAPSTVIYVNPLDYVAMEEPCDQFIEFDQIRKYIGEVKGIQGYQNSCYLDTILFGLFAVNDAFDNFLEPHHSDPEVMHILRKGIVNPLRKNGVVRYEAVLRLRDKLTVIEEKKDPREFLGMFNHIPPLLNTRCSSGIVHEHSVQLCFEAAADFIAIPTVEELLKKKFHEHSMWFVEAPKKLLLQISYTEQNLKKKVLPGYSLKLDDILNSDSPCFMCGSYSAWQECRQCPAHFGTDSVVYFCDGCAQLAHGKATNRSNHNVMKVQCHVPKLELLSVICITDNHYTCFSRSGNKWIFFDSMGIKISDVYYIPKVMDCTNELNEWVYPINGDLSNLTNALVQPPECVRHFTQDMYMCVYIQSTDKHQEIAIESYSTPNTRSHSLLMSSFAIIQQCLDESQKVNHHLQERNQKLTHERNVVVISLNKTLQELTTCNQLLWEERAKNKSQITKHDILKHENENLHVSLQSMKQQLHEFEDQLHTAQVEIQQITEAKETMESECQLQCLVLQVENESIKRENEMLKQQVSDIQEENQQLHAAQQESVAFGIDPWKVSRDKVELGRLIGGGGWGAVTAGKLAVAVKQFFPNILSEENLSRLKREMRILALIRHPNLLQFIAAVFEDHDDPAVSPPYIVTELLDANLRVAYEKKIIAEEHYISIFQDTARALDYLHRRHEPIIHRDVSSANVLLKHLPSGYWMAKVSDLGSANLAREAYSMNEGAVVYCAPEAFTDESNTRSLRLLTPKVDVYSYGIVLCEVATSTFPDKKKFLSMLERIHTEWPNLCQLIDSCIVQDPEQRPTMATVLTVLEEVPPQPQDDVEIL